MNSENLYEKKESFFHKLDGSVKLLLLLTWMIFVFLFLDLRVFIGVIILGACLMGFAKLDPRKVFILTTFVFVFTIFNSLFLLIVTPTYGSELTGTTTPAFSFIGIEVTLETVIYILTMTLKYFALLPITLIFVFTTDPSEFAASLNRIKVPYKVAYAVNIAMRYIPDVAYDMKVIKNAQELKGIEFSTKNKIKDLRNYAYIMVPLIKSSIERINNVANSMDMRCFGKSKYRTWYNQNPLTKKDYIVSIILLAILIISFYIKFAVNPQFYYPFN